MSSFTDPTDPLNSGGPGGGASTGGIDPDSTYLARLKANLVDTVMVIHGDAQNAELTGRISEGGQKAEVSAEVVNARVAETNRLVGVLQETLNDLHALQKRDARVLHHLGEMQKHSDMAVEHNSKSPGDIHQEEADAEAAAEYKRISARNKRIGWTAAGTTAALATVAIVGHNRAAKPEHKYTDTHESISRRQASESSATVNFDLSSHKDLGVADSSKFTPEEVEHFNGVKAILDRDITDRATYQEAKKNLKEALTGSTASNPELAAQELAYMLTRDHKQFHLNAKSDFTGMILAPTGIRSPKDVYFDDKSMVGLARSGDTDHGIEKNDRLANALDKVSIVNLGGRQ